MRFLYQFTLLLLKAVFVLNLISTPAPAQNYVDAVPPEGLDDQERAQMEQGMTAEELTQPIPIEELILEEEQNVAIFENLSEYTLGFQDVIEVSVLRHDEVSGQYIINAEGDIQYEFVGDIKIAGLKKDQVKDLLVEKLSHYIISPEVTVKIVGYNSKILFVVGEVRSPGKIFMRGDTMTVREALVQAGLPLLSGKLKDARLITPDETGKAKVKKINVHKLLYEGDLRENLVMAPGDTLYIPPTFLAKTMRVIQPVAAPISAAGGAARNVYMPGF
ncbi:MAG TPA: polysaccharide biosynthesis/export family protein [Candidatus Omnitrophota bacterium]|nr:polysaccharide biosynthesis/export family protein [Candidatus Omnitrophota bacterium]